MHFRTSPTKTTSRSSITLHSPATKLHPVATVESVSSSSSESESLEDDIMLPGIAAWDFAYENGKCTLPVSMKKNCCFSKCFLAANAKMAAANAQSKLLVGTVAPAYEGLKAQEKKFSKKSKGDKRAAADDDAKTYLVSSPTISSILCPQTYLIISSLLNQPNTNLIYLVPQSNIVCPKVCELMRLPRAKGSSFRVLPIEADIEMRCTPASEGASVGSMADEIAINEVADKLVKNTKARSFDGYIALEDEREAWMFLERVGKGVQQHAMRRG
jgi:hypothetical protein